MGEDQALSLESLRQSSVKEVLKLPLHNLNSLPSAKKFFPLIAGVDS